MATKINLNERYFPHEELYGKTKGEAHYMPMFKSLNEFFDLSKSSNIIDVGCREGWLLSLINLNFPKNSVLGIDYFPWMKDSAPNNIKNDFRIWDMRDTIEESTFYTNYNGSADLIISTEVGEHIDPAYANTYLQNIYKLLNKEGSLVMSWCEIGGDKHGQHVNPLKRKEFIQLMSDNGFQYVESDTEEFIKTCRLHGVQEYYIESNLSIFKKNTNDSPI